MKYIRLFASFFALMMLLCAGASAEITITKRDINMNTALDKNVSNILVLLQDGGETDTMMIASINSRTGRSVMLRVNCDLTVDVPENGETRLADVYALGAKKSRGLVAERAVNTLLGLNVGTYVALDVSSLPELVDAVDTVSMELTDAEAEAMNLDAGWNDLTGDEALTFVRLKLDGDDPARSRGYDMLMQLLYAGVNSGDLGSMLGLGTKLLDGYQSERDDRRHAGFRRQGRRRPQRNGAADGGAGDERKPAAGRRNGHAEHGERGAV